MALARHLGIDPVFDTDLLWIAEKVRLTNPKPRGLCFDNLFANQLANSCAQFGNCSRTGVREFSANNIVVRAIR